MRGADCTDFCRTNSIREIVDHNCKCKDCCICVEHHPRKRRRRTLKKPQCFKKDISCPQRIEQIAKPRLRTAELTLQRYSTVIQPERMINMCRLITELRLPQKKPVNFWKLKRRRHRRHHRKSKRSNEKWLEKQACKSANVFRHYLGEMTDYVPIYKQLLISAKLWCALEFRKLRICNKYVKPELKKVCDKLAILIDTKLKPYKQQLHIEAMSVCTLEDKHVVFKMMGSVTEIEEVEEEEEESIPSSLFELPTSFEVVEEEEQPYVTLPEELKQFFEEFEAEMEESLRGIEEELEEEEEVLPFMAEIEPEELLMEEEYMEMPIEIEESISIQAAIEEELSIFEEAEAEAEAAKLQPASEEESVMEAPEEEIEPDHPEGTSSYIDWCLYVSWLKEFGYNIEMYANCLKKFRCVLSREDSGKHQAILKFLLTNWSKYLAESRQVDNEMTQYFKDKPVTWCDKCRDCTIDDYPRDHYIPPELEHAINSTKEWRRLLAEADEYCKKLCPEEGEEEEESLGAEMYEIYNVVSSSSSSFDIETVPLQQVTTKSDTKSAPKGKHKK